MNQCRHIKWAGFVFGCWECVKTSCLRDNGCFFTRLGCCSPQICSTWKRAAAPLAEAGEQRQPNLSEPLKVCSCSHICVSSIWSDGKVSAVMVSLWQCFWICLMRILRDDDFATISRSLQDDLQFLKKETTFSCLHWLLSRILITIATVAYNETVFLRL